MPLRLSPAQASSLAKESIGLPRTGSKRVRIPDQFRRKRWEKAGKRKSGKQLGRKVGYTLHHWRLKQKQTHDRLIKSATSHVGSEVSSENLFHSPFNLPFAENEKEI